MRFISYAQNFEDIMLHRALKDVAHGFYIDVGAHDPVFHSVTKAFYDRGWSGINIEPVPSSYERFVRERPRDINLMVVASDVLGETTLYQFSGTGLSTTSSELAHAHEASGFDASSVVCQQQTLEQICDQYAKGAIHFLKIDVEGSEEACLRGNDFNRHRPWIVVVESTVPMSSHQKHSGWETILTDASYEFSYFDGLNRFYVAAEHRELAQRLTVPPNVFDDFVRASEVDATSEISHRLVEANNRITGLQRQLANLGSLDAIVTVAQGLQTHMGELSGIVARLATQNDARQVVLTEQVTTLTRSLEQAQSRLLALDEENAQLRTAVQALQSSLSWRLTRPLRAIRRIARS